MCIWMLKCWCACMFICVVDHMCTCFDNHMLTHLLPLMIICFYVHMFWWSLTSMFTCFDHYTLLCSHALMILCSHVYLLRWCVAFMFTFLIFTYFYVHMLWCSYISMFTCFDDCMLLCLHALKRTCPLAYKP